MEFPLVSIIMGIYNQRADTGHVRRSIESILNQSMCGWELLLCDDGSTPETCELLDQFALLDSRILLMRKGGCFTLPSKLNFCLEKARGCWVARMDDDDYSYPRRLERQLVYIKQHPEIAFTGCNVALCRDGQRVGERCFPEFPQIRDFYFTQPFIHPTLLFRRQALEAVGGYSEDKYCILCEDYDLLLRLYEKGFCGANLQEILFDYTIPATAKGNRKYSHRINEAVTRYRRYRNLKVLNTAWPYVLKPLAVGLLPETFLRRWKGFPT